jgi:hypothetical protein
MIFKHFYQKMAKISVVDLETMLNYAKIEQNIGF